MKLEITCPQCGYNEYKAYNTTSNKEVTIVISKCETTGCDLQIIEEDVFMTFENQNDLMIDSRYKLLEQTFSDCIVDEDLN
jgi:uncharacterized Zn finger protein